MTPTVSGPITTPALTVGTHSYFVADLKVLTWHPLERVLIGNYCSIAGEVVICTGGMRHTDKAAQFPLDPARSYQTTPTTTLGHDVWVGYRAMILAGAQVGDGAVIASGSVVFNDVPPYAIVAGNPARLIRYRFSRDVVARLLRIAWWSWPDETIRQHLDWFYGPIQEFVDRFDPPPNPPTHE